jgi:subtilase family serine protease
MIASQLGAQSVAPRISSEITNSERATLTGSLHPLAQAQFDAGRVPAATKLQGITIVFSRSEAQEADLQTLLAEQQDPASPLYHQWLTPDEFAARFGMADSDISKVEAWLQQQGFSIDSVARSRNMIHFSGNVRQVEQAFSTEMHYYKVDGKQHFAPSTELSVPLALAPVVVAVRDLNDFRPKSMHVNIARPDYTFCCDSSNQDVVLFAPGDIKTAYNIPSTDTGTGQAIAIMGQSAIVLSDIENFQSAAGIQIKDPSVILVPNTGSSVTADGDESESDIDLEWSGAVAPGATINFVYTGNAPNTGGVFDSLSYAVDQKIGNIISISYGTCEAGNTPSDLTSMEAVTSQGASQGQTIVVSSGDSGSTGCYGNYGNTNNTAPVASDEVLTVNYPASSAYVTAMGGTEITNANDAVGTYWSTAGTSGISLNTALSHIPEVAWNDDSASFAAENGWQFALASGGGGVSTIIPRPTWQTGVTGIPSGSFRLVPDISLYSSPNNPGYLYCTSDMSAWYPGSSSNPAQEASCGAGQFYDDITGYFNIAGGTSFAAPIFAGMVAIINQEKNYTDGQGLVNPTLYTLASNSSTYSSAFYDITAGGPNGGAGIGNECTAGSSYCSTAGSGSYKTTTGYDEATGLGSVNLGALITAWPAGTGGTLISTTTGVTASPTSALVNASINFTISVTSTTGSTVPTGNISLSVDGGTAFTEALTANGTYVYPTSFTSAGTHTVTAQYEGDATHGTSFGSASVTISAVSSGTGTFTVTASPSPLTVAQGSTGTETLTITPSGGYTGTVWLTFDTSNDTALGNLCYEFTTMLNNDYGSVVVSGTSAVQTQLQLITNAATCGAVSPRTGGGQQFHRLGAAKTAKNSGANPAPLGLAFAGLLLAGFLGRYSRKFHGMAVLIALLAVGLAVSACGGGSNGGTTTVTNPPKGTYTITVFAQDSVSTCPGTSCISGQTTFTFTID